MPAFNSFIYIILDKSFSFIKTIPIILCLLGIYFVLSENHNKINIGDIIILSGAFIWALGGYLNDKANIELDMRVASTIQLIFATLVTLVFLLIFSPEWREINLSRLNITDILSILYVGIIGNGVAFVIFYKLMTKFGSSYTSYSLMLVPVVGVLFSILLNNEAVNLNMLIGLFLMLASMIMKNYIIKN